MSCISILNHFVNHFTILHETKLWPQVPCCFYIFSQGLFFPWFNHHWLENNKNICWCYQEYVTPVILANQRIILWLILPVSLAYPNQKYGNKWLILSEDLFIFTASWLLQDFSHHCKLCSWNPNNYPWLNSLFQDKQGPTVPSKGCETPRLSLLWTHKWLIYHLIMITKGNNSNPVDVLKNIPIKICCDLKHERVQCKPNNKKILSLNHQQKTQSRGHVLEAAVMRYQKSGYELIIYLYIIIHFQIENTWSHSKKKKKKHLSLQPQTPGPKDNCWPAVLSLNLTTYLIGHLELFCLLDSSGDLASRHKSFSVLTTQSFLLRLCSFNCPSQSLEVILHQCFNHEFPRQH